MLYYPVLYCAVVYCPVLCCAVLCCPVLSSSIFLNSECTILLFIVHTVDTHLLFSISVNTVYRIPSRYGYPPTAVFKSIMWQMYVWPHLPPVAEGESAPKVIVDYGTPLGVCNVVLYCVVLCCVVLCCVVLCCVVRSEEHTSELQSQPII